MQKENKILKQSAFNQNKLYLVSPIINLIYQDIINKQVFSKFFLGVGVCTKPAKPVIKK